MRLDQSGSVASPESCTHVKYTDSNCPCGTQPRTVPPVPRRLQLRASLYPRTTLTYQCQRVLLGGVKLTEARPETPDQRFYFDEHLFVDLRHQVVLLDSKILNLTRMEYLLLALLVQQGGEVVPRPILLVATRAADMYIRRLQRKFRARQYIERVIGVGYRFRPAFFVSGKLETVN